MRLFTGDSGSTDAFCLFELPDSRGSFELADRGDNEAVSKSCPGNPREKSLVAISVDRDGAHVVEEFEAGSPVRPSSRDVPGEFASGILRWRFRQNVRAGIGEADLSEGRSKSLRRSATLPMRRGGTSDPELLSGILVTLAAMGLYPAVIRPSTVAAPGWAAPRRVKNESPDFDFGSTFEVFARDRGSPSLMSTLSTRLIPDGAGGFGDTLRTGDPGALGVESLSASSLLVVPPWPVLLPPLDGVVGILFAC